MPELLSLKEIKISPFGSESNEMIKRLLKKCPNLESYDDEFIITSDILSCLELLCPKIKRLSVIYLKDSTSVKFDSIKSVSFFHVKNDIVIDFIRNNPSLEHICGDFTPNENCLKAFKNHPNLKYFGGCYKSFDDLLQEMLERNIIRGW